MATTAHRRPSVVRAAPGGPPVEEVTNVQAIADLETTARAQRTPIEYLTDAISRGAGSPAFIVFHLVWFGVWIGVNSTARAFDPYPYNLLTLAVSLEAIVLSGFLLMAQNRMTREADRRAHLDLQVNLLAEQELTAILRILLALSKNAGVDVSHCHPSIAHFEQTTDVRELADLVETRLENPKAKGGGKQ